MQEVQLAALASRLSTGEYKEMSKNVLIEMSSECVVDVDECVIDVDECVVDVDECVVDVDECVYLA